MVKKNTINQTNDKRILKTLEQLLAKEYTSYGYAITSREFGRASRLDRPDWVDHMAKLHAPWDPDCEGMRWVFKLGYREAADFYRRVHSHDHIEVSETIRKLMVKSGDGMINAFRQSKDFYSGKKK
jgi:hypothetical protein